MNSYEAPCYTLDETEQALSLNRSELIHALRTGTIEAVVYVKGRSMVLFSPKKDGSWIGHATCRYRGHMTLHRSYILQLADGDNITVGAGWGRLLDEEGVDQWTTQYPFKSPPPHNKFSKWIEARLDILPLRKMASTPTPLEHKAVHIFTRDMMGGILRTVQAFAGEKVDQNPEIIEEYLSSQEKQNHELNDHELNFDKHSEFTPDDLRIPASEIKRYQLRSMISSKPHLSLATQPPKNTRENQLHSLIERALEIEPEASAKELWRALQADSNIDIPQLDTDNIITQIDDSCIEWRSRHGAEPSMKWASFKVTVSKIKKRVKTKVT